MPANKYTPCSEVSYITEVPVHYYCNYLFGNVFKIDLPFLERLSSAAKTAQLARAAPPATQAMKIARASGGTSGSGTSAGAVAGSAISRRPAGNVSGSMTRTPRHSRSPPSGSRSFFSVVIHHDTDRSFQHVRCVRGNANNVPNFRRVRGFRYR